MAKYLIGEYIYDARKRMGYTQEELAEGICTTGTLSKIENGSRVPTAGTYEALMQRLGEPASFFSVYVGKKELEVENICRKVLRILARHQLENPGLVLGEYQAVLEKYKLVESQIMLCMKAICHSQMEEPPEAVMEELLLALNEKKPVDVEVWIKEERKFLTFDEIIIWNNIAIQYKRMKNFQKAIDIWSALQLYLNNHEVDNEERAKVYPVILYNLAGTYSLVDLHMEAVERCEEGIRVCVEYGKLFPLPYLLKYKGYELMEIGQIHGAKQYIMQADMIFGILRKDTLELLEEMVAAF